MYQLNMQWCTVFASHISVDNMSRAFLTTYIPGATDYINAVFVDVSISLMLPNCSNLANCSSEEKAAIRRVFYRRGSTVSRIQNHFSEIQGYKHKDAFIVTQMPLPTTVLDLWTLIFDHKCKTIVMINPLNPMDEVSRQYFT